MKSKIKIIIADDHSVLRAGLKLLLNNEGEFAVIAEAANGEEVLDLLRSIAADVLIIDLSMPVMGALNVLRKLKVAAMILKF